MKSMCFTQVYECGLVEMVVGGLEYSIRKKIDTQYHRYMVKLADRIRQVEHLKAEKLRFKKNLRKDKVAYVEIGDFEVDFDEDFESVEENEVNLAE